MRTALIIHGAYGTPNENWFPWLKQELETRGYQVIIHQFPTPDNQRLPAWLAVAKTYFNQLNANSIVIGHSIGATFILRLLEQLNQPVAIAALVAGFISDLPDSNLNQINHTFYDQPFHWDKIISNAHHFLLYQSPNDPFVPMKHGEELADHLQQYIISIPNAGHFNKASGYHQFPQLLQDLLSQTPS